MVRGFLPRAGENPVLFDTPTFLVYRGKSPPNGVGV